MSKSAKKVVVAIIAVVVVVAAIWMQGSVSHYEVPAVVYGYESNGSTLFKTQDNNIWSFNLSTRLEKGREVTLNMYDRSPDGKSVKENVVCSVVVDGHELEEVVPEGE